MPFYRNYTWKEGIPYGVEAVSPNVAIAYKIPMDPYRKRITIEKYSYGKFCSILYDSALLDFRHLKPAEQIAWQKIIMSEDDTETISHIYNQDDRLILIETYQFENKLCRSCKTTSGHGITLSYQKMYYKALKDTFDGVILYDSNEHKVMFKRYAIEEDSNQFGELIEESWDGGKIPIVMSPLIAH